MHNLLQAWGLPGAATLHPTSIGYMNLTHFVETPSGSYVLRIYQAQTDLNRIRFEHAITAWLQQAGLSFAVPAPLPSLSGETLVQAPNPRGGQVLASLFPVLPGVHPKQGNIVQNWAAGAALGELVGALASVPPDLVRQAGSTYRDLRTAHPDVPDLVPVVEHLPLPPVRRRRMLELIARLLDEAPRLYERLPKQVIHGDCTNGNLLLTDDRVAGFLDFEFAGWDVRAMDFAVGLGGGPSGQRGPGAAWEELEAFSRGYASQHRLSAEEIEAVPLLISLRRTAMLAHFAHRWQLGLDTEEFLVHGIVGWVLDEGEDWLAAVSADLVRRLHTWFR